jgi:hypothetical protein
MAIAIYTVWTKNAHDPELLAMFTNDEAAQEYADKHNGLVFTDEAYETVKEQESMQLF